MGDLPLPTELQLPRTGSLLSVNLLAVSLALRAVEDWLSGAGTPFSQLYVASLNGGDVSIERREYDRNPVCAACRQWGGGYPQWARWTV